MRKNSGDYDVVFTFKDVGLKDLNELHRVVNSVLSEDQFDITITDPIGGTHIINLNKGVKPNKEECDNCLLIDCRECPKYNTEGK